jgi:chromosome segregation ATPase
LKEEALAKLAAGASARSVARELELSNNTVSRWAREAANGGSNGNGAADAAAARVAAAEARIADLLTLRAKNAEALEAVEQKLKDAEGDQDRLDALLIARLSGDQEAGRQLDQIEGLRRERERLAAERGAIDRAISAAEKQLEQAEAEVRLQEQRARAARRLETAAAIERQVDALVAALTDHFQLCRQMYAGLGEDARGNRFGRAVLGKEIALNHIKARLAALFPGDDPGSREHFPPIR